MIKLGYLGGVARPHSALQSLAGDRENVVEIGNAASRQALFAAEDYLCRQLPNRPGDERDDHATDGLDDFIARQDNDGAITGWRRTKSPISSRTPARGF